MASTESRQLIDWALAGRVARTMAGNGGDGDGAVELADLRRAARGSVGQVRDYTGLETKGRLPSPEVVDRPQWIEANMASLRAISSGAEERLGESLELPWPIGPALRAAAGAAAGVELGIASGFLAQRVLGQYDVALLGPQRPTRLLFVGPNLAEAERRVGAEREPFLRWIALHESTHVVQFNAVPWLRGHIGGLGERLLSEVFEGVGAGELAAMARRALISDPRKLVDAVRDGQWLSPFIGAPRRALLDQLQAAMVTVEGYSEHVMDAIGAELGPAYAEMRSAVESNRASRGPVESLLSRLLGLEMKMRQYRQGKAFCDEVADRRGIAALNIVWSEPEALPRPAELQDPGRWIARVA
jgi:coenzyme F420 biosynthesis associated uncharacterized protein